MAKKTVLVSDLSDVEIDEGKGATIRITFHDARKGVREKDIALDVSLQIAAHFGQNLDHLCHLTRYDDNTLTLQRRCDLASDWGADVFVSVHCNSFEDPRAEGFEVWTNPDVDPADKLASMMWYDWRGSFPDMKGRVDLSDGDPDKESKFWVLVHTRMPAVLFELAFISNLDDEGRLLSLPWRARAARVLVNAIREWGMLL